MLPRLSIILKLFFCTMFIFILQKPLFMLYNHTIDASISTIDYLEVMLHGVPLDLTTTGYLLILPLLLITISFFYNNPKQTKSLILIYCAIISILIAVIFVTDTVMYDFWRFKLDSSIFIYTDKPADAIASVSTSFLLIRLFAVIFFSIIYFLIYWWLLHEQEVSRPLHNILSLIMIPVFALVFLMIRGGVGEGTANVSNAYYSERQFLNHSAVNPCFSIFYSLGKTQDFANEFHFFDDADRTKYIQGIYHTKSTGTEKILTNNRPNILLIIWEGCGAKIVEAVGGEKGVTPCLNKIANEGIVFTNCYANSFRTDRGLVSILSGWLALPTASLMKIPEKCETLPALPRKLREVGYKTEFWYGGDITFTNMNGYMLQAGMQYVVSKDDFSIKERSFSKWGVADGVLLERVTADIEKRYLIPGQPIKPWFTSVLTLSSHEPWEVPTRTLDEMRRNSFAYTDKCIGTMIDRIKATQAWDNLLVIIMPDHGIPFDETDTTNDPRISHIPIVMTGGAIKERGRYDMIMNQSDFASTLLAQLGIPHDEFTFSRDVLSSSYTYPTAFHTTNEGMTFIDSTGVTTYDNNAQKTTRTEGKNNPLRELKAKAILQTLYENIANR